MIESITVSNVATYDNTPSSISNLSKFNFLFGSNGTGKTTISRIIANADSFPTCKLNWKGGTKLQPMVFNRDFVDRNFNQSEELKGVFTLGENQVDTLKKIADFKVQLDDLISRIKTLTVSLQGVDGNSGKKEELASLENRFKEACWAEKRKHDAKLKGAFKGYRNDSSRFKDKVLHEQTTNRATLLSLPDLEKKSASVFGPPLTREERIAVIDTTTLAAHETNSILKKRVIGKDDVDISAMIKKLGNSDWIREGRSFYDANNKVCPFCQQGTSEIFAQSLNEYFDETFITDSKAIDDLATNYSNDADRIQQQLISITGSPSKLLDTEKLKYENELLRTKIALNSRRLAEKKKEPSKAIELESLGNISASIKSLIDSANTKIEAHNKVVNNLETERSTLTAHVWRFILEEIKAELTKYATERQSMEKAICGLKEAINRAESDKKEKAAEIRKLEKQTTSIQPTIDGINQLLSSFGFQNFKIAKAENRTSYKLVRPDGSDAKATLSEGERNFVSFLYFYYLLKGSESDSGMTTDRVIVFDDPVSSLDSDILFIVGSLIKGLFNEVRNGNGHIKQIFILTHNVYFHKEVTYNPNRREIAMKEETFWIVRKSGMNSTVEHQSTNPIKTSYELLWSEVRKKECSNVLIQNTLRRILENYFKILGGLDLDKLCALFEGRERLVCKSLCSWVHDGSHYAYDDLYVSIGDSMVEIYLSVFRKIFDKSGHLEHYNMMMGNNSSEESPPRDGAKGWRSDSLTS